jgi:hypothetical protein
MNLSSDRIGLSVGGVALLYTGLKVGLMCDSRVHGKAENIQKKKILFFVCFGTHNNKIHTMYKQTSVFVLIFPCCCFAFISKAATTKNRYFIYHLSMICLGLGSRPKHSLCCMYLIEVV